MQFWILNISIKEWVEYILKTQSAVLKVVGYLDYGNITLMDRWTSVSDSFIVCHMSHVVLTTLDTLLLQTLNINNVS